MSESPPLSAPQKRSVLKNRWVQACIIVIALQIALFFAVTGSVALFYYLPQQEMARLDNPDLASFNVDNYRFKSVEDFTKAEAKLKELVSSPTYHKKPIVHYLMGRLYQVQGRDGQAYRHFYFAVKYANQNLLDRLRYNHYEIRSLENMGALCYKSNEYKYALFAYERLTSMGGEQENHRLSRLISNRLREPERADFHWLLAQELKETMNFPQAREELKETIRLSKDPHLRIEAENYLKTQLPKGNQDLSPIQRYYMLAANAAEDNEQSSKAISLYKKVLEEAPTFEWAHQQLAILYREAGKAKLAQWHAAEGLRINPDFYQASLTLGDLALDRQDFTAALKHYERAKAILTRYPLDENAEMLANLENQLGYTQESLQAFANALRHYEQALSIARANPDEEDMDFNYAEEAIARIHRQQAIQQNSRLADSRHEETAARLSTLQY